MERIVTFPRMGIYTNLFKELLNNLGVEVMLPPPITEKTIKLGVRHSSSMMCLTEDTNITIDDYTSKPIKDINVGDMVLTHKGRFKKVTQIFSRDYEGKILHIDCGGLLNFKITPEHPVLSIKREKIACLNFTKHQLPIICKPEMKDSVYCKKHNKRCKRRKGLIDFTIDFMPINSLKKGDFLAIPIPKNIGNISSFILENDSALIKYKNNQFKYISELLRIIGYWLAEGSILHNRNKTRRGISFVFSSDEINYINEIIDIIRKNFNCSISQRSQKTSCIELIIHSKTLADIFFSLCNEYCDKKKLHKDLMNLSPELQVEILKGFFRGDGHLYKKHTYFATTTSYNLFNQLFWILIRNGIKPCIYKTKQINRKEGYNFKIIHSKNIRQIDNEIDITFKKEVSGFFKTDDYFLVPIKKIKETEFNGKVYNLEIEEDNSYIANFLTVHNCYPFKITIGSLVEVLEEAKKKNIKLTYLGIGTSTICMSSCRFQQYFEIQKKICEDLGYDFDTLFIESKMLPRPFGYMLGIVDTFQKMNPKNSKIEITKEIINILKRMREEEKKMDFFDWNDKEKIKIGIVGESYACIEPFMNYNIFERLKNKGINTHTFVIYTNELKRSYKEEVPKRFVKEAKKYYKGIFRAHGDSSYYALYFYKHHNFDAVLHLFPLSCMPQNTAQMIMDLTAKRLNLPLYNFPLDEDNFQTGFEMRLDSIISILKKRKEAKCI